MRTTTLTLPCPGDDGACPATLTVEVDPGSPDHVSGPPDSWYQGDPAGIVNVAGCQHADQLATAWAFEEAIFARLDELDRRAYDDAMDARGDRARDDA